MKLIIVVMLFFLVGAFYIISENNLALRSPENVETLNEIYFSWMSKIFDNSKEITGYVVKMDWLPNES